MGGTPKSTLKTSPSQTRCRFPSFLPEKITVPTFSVRFNGFAGCFLARSVHCAANAQALLCSSLYSQLGGRHA